MQDYSDSGKLPDGLFDIVVVGSGVVGCAMARRFTLEGARVLVLEKACVWRIPIYAAMGV